MRNLVILFLMVVHVQLIAQPMRVMTYNIRLNTTADGPNHWPKRMDKVFALILGHQPDLLGVQEAMDGQMHDLIDNLGDYAYVGVGRDDGKTAGEYSAILYRKDRFKVVEQNTFWLSETPEVPGSKSWDASITRVASWAIFEDLRTEKKFLMVNTHFDHIGKEARRNSATLIQQRISKISNGLPVILSGDFNAQRDEPPFAAVTSGEFLELYDSRPADNRQGTYCTFSVNGPACTAIDYIFYSKGWTATGYKVVTDHNGTYYPSDHLPVLVEFTQQ
ncbi:MAG: endonuclease/exonuclease/phosphatase family protein [Bacteroidia bacterium]|nr:endonuclease/exonuclease/phosphatase family protein [Bacteroidia bacterium]